MENNSTNNEFKLPSVSSYLIGTEDEDPNYINKFLVKSDNIPALDSDFNSDKINIHEHEHKHSSSCRHSKINTETRQQKKDRIKREKKQRKQDLKNKPVKTPNVFVHNDTGKIVINTCKLIDQNYIGSISMDNGNKYIGTFFVYMSDDGYHLTMNGYGERIVNGKHEKGYFDSHVLSYGV